MARRRLTRKEIKQPDQFISFTAQSIEWIKAHAMYLLYGGLGVLIVIGLIVAWTTWQHHREQRANVLLYQATKQLTTAADETSEAEVTPQARAAATQQLQTVIQDYAGTPAAARANWHLGHLYFEDGKYQQALAAYERAHQGLDETQLLSRLVLLNLSYTHEALGACDRAITGFESVVQSSATWLHGEAYLGLGRCYEQTGALAEALTTYEQALAAPAVSGATRQQIEARQARLRARAEAEAPQASPSTAPSSTSP